MSRTIDLLTKEQVLALRRYEQKRVANKLSEVTPEEREARRLYSEFTSKLNPLRSRYYTKRSDAKKAGHLFNLTLEDFVLLCSQTTHCPVLGLPLDYSAAHGRGLQDNAASLDRLDNNKGYTKENCWVISHKANKLKNEANLEELKLLVSALEARLTNDSPEE